MDNQIVYIKSYPPRVGLFIKAIGIVTNNDISIHDLLGSVIDVEWLWVGNIRVGKLDDKFNVRRNTVYEECHPDIQDIIINTIIEGYRNNYSSNHD